MVIECFNRYSLLSYYFLFSNVVGLECRKPGLDDFKGKNNEHQVKHTLFLAPGPASV